MIAIGPDMKRIAVIGTERPKCKINPFAAYSRTSTGLPIGARDDSGLSGSISHLACARRAYAFVTNNSTKSAAQLRETRRAWAFQRPHTGCSTQYQRLKNCFGSVGRRGQRSLQSESAAS